METIKVLVADDHAIVREGLRLILSREPDIEVVAEASDGDEAVKKAIDVKPDVAVLDISMPNQNGIEATRAIKRAVPNVGVLILTVHEGDEYVYDLLKAGANAYLLKKSAGAELAGAVRAVAHGDLFLARPVAESVIENFLSKPRNPVKEVKAVDGLTDREIEVLKLIALGKSNKEIAKMLFLSVKTVESHRGSIFRKLGLHDRAQAAAYAVRKGLVD